MQEVAQDLTAPVAQSIASALNGAIPGVDWSKEFTNLKDAAPEVVLVPARLNEDLPRARLEARKKVVDVPFPLRLPDPL